MVTLPLLALLAVAPAPAGKIAPALARALERGPAEMIVVLADQADLGPARGLPTRSEKARFVVGALRATAERAQGPLSAWLSARGMPVRGFTVVDAVLTRGDAAAALALAERPDVARLEANPLVRGIPPAPETSPIAPLAVEPGVSQVNAPAVWATGIRGAGVVVADADTGVRWDHAALVAQYRGTTPSGTDHDFSWHDAVHENGGSCGADSIVPCDANGHGTHTTGFMVGDDGMGNQIGVAPGARWIACRNMDAGGNGTPARYLECMDFFLAPYPVGGSPSGGDPALAPDVVNNSWGCPPSEGCSTTTLDAALAAQKAAGILNVASAGNSGSSCATITDPPATSPDVLTVGALQTGTTAIATFSSRGPVAGLQKPDLVAPGTSLRSSNPASTTSYTSGSGTSFSGPLVAGVAALVLSSQPFLRNEPDRTMAVLRTSAASIASTACSSAQPVPNNVFGWGNADAMAAVRAAAGPLAFHTLVPCRLVDTRQSPGPLGGPALDPGAARDFTAAGACGIPADARALVLNVTAADPGAAGHLQAGAAGAPQPATSVVNFPAGTTRAGMAVVGLDAQGSLAVWCGIPPGSPRGTDLVLDVSGYFR